MTRLAEWLVALALSPALGSAAAATAPIVRADYGLPRRPITRAQLGLGPREVLIAPFSAVSSYTSAGHRFDEYVLKLAAAGLVNRSGPLLWLDMVDFVGGPESNLAAELEWRTYYSETRGIRFVPLDGGLDGLLRRVAKPLGGIVIYDWDCRTMPSDNVVLALNIANLNRCLPVSRRLYDAHRESLRGVRIVATIENLGWNREQIYDWLVREAAPRMDRASVHSLCAGFADLHQRDDWNFLHGLDYAFYRKCLVFNLTPLRAPTRYDGVTLDGDPQMARILDRVLGSYRRKPVAVLGWGEPEPVYVERVSSAGHYVNCTAAACDLSFHAAMKPMKKPPYGQPGAPRIASPERKVYLAFVANEGDAIKSQTLMYNRAWEHHPGRGQVPINWAVNPASVERWPAVFEYYGRTRTPSDYFVGAPNGGGYLNPSANPWLAEFLRNTARTMPDMGIRELGLWYPTLESVDRYARALPLLRGIDITPHEARPHGEIFSAGTRRVPVVRYAPPLWYWQTRVDLQSGYRIDIPKFTAYLDRLHAEGPLPAFANVYGVEANLVGEIARLAAVLDPARFQIVDYATFFHLAAQTAKPLPMRTTGGSASVPWAPSLLHEPSAWTERLNDARVSCESDGLRVAAAPGLPWAVAAMRNLAIPPGADRVRVRVRSLSGKGAEWICKLYGDLDGFGLDENWFFGGAEAPTTYEAPLDPRVSGRRAGPWMLQLGVHGPEGGEAVFESVEFVGRAGGRRR